MLDVACMFGVVLCSRGYMAITCLHKSAGCPVGFAIPAVSAL